MDVVVVDRPSGFGGKGGKMKREKSYHKAVRRPEDEDEGVVMPSLKTDFTLPVGSMPSFNFNAGGGKRSQESSNEDKEVGQKFTFSSPIQRSVPSQPSVGKKANFSFSSPLKVTENETSTKSSMFTSGSGAASFKPVLNSAATVPISTLGNGGIGMNFTSSSAGQSFKTTSDAKQSSGSPAGVNAVKFSNDLRHGSVMDVLGKDSFTSPSGMKDGFGQLKSGSVMDVLGKSPSNSSSSSSGKSGFDLKQGSVMDVLGGKSSSNFGTAASEAGAASSFAKSSGSRGLFGIQSSLKQGSVMDALGKKSEPAVDWDCDTCLVQNKAQVSKCVACGTSKPGPPPQPPTPVTTATSDLLSKFKPPSGSWTCDTCLIQNDADISKCVACGNTKPGGSAPTSSGGSIGSGRPISASMFKSSGAWNCDICLVQNKSEHDKCVACQSPKPGANKSGTSGGSLSSGQPSLASMFKSTGSWICDTCMIQNKSEDTKCVACQSAKPGSSKTVSDDSESKPATKVSADGFKISGGLTFGSSTSGSIAGEGFKLGSFSSISSNSKSGFGGAGFSLGGQGLTFGQPTSSKTDSVTSPSNDTAVTSGDKASKSDATSAATSSAPQTSVPCGFTFGAVSENKPVQESESESSATTSAEAINGPFKSNAHQSGSSGFVFGGKLPPETGKSVNSDTDAAKPGFHFGQKSDTESKMTSSVIGTPAMTSNAFSVGTSAEGNTGFSFGNTASTKTDTTKSESSGTVSGFSFGQQDSTKSSATESKPASSDLFLFGQTVGPTDSSKPLGTSGFNFAATTKDISVAAKRGRDDETGAPTAKKSFSFSTQSSAPPAGGFGLQTAATVVTTASSMFTIATGAAGANEKPQTSNAFGFGATSALTSFGAGQPAPTTNPTFQFTTQQPSSSGTSAVFQFGSTTTPVPPQNTGFGFGATPVTTATATASFGNTNALPQPAFGSTANSAPQTGAQGAGMFGSTGSAFGTNNSSTTVPVFGGTPDQNAGSGFSFNMTKKQNSASNFNFGGSSGGVFQFSAKGSENAASAPAQGCATSGFAFGGSQQPQPGAPAPSFNSNSTFSFNTNTAGFSMGSSTTQEGGRKIKRAVRKIRK